MFEFSFYVRNIGPPDSVEQLEVRIFKIPGSAGGDDSKFVTPWLKTLAEIDFYIDRMIAALETVRTQAKGELLKNG